MTKQKNGRLKNDEFYTPGAVMDAITAYFVKFYHLEGKRIIRPFYPGGDYENEYYGDGVVIDNPPFSQTSPIITFYLEHNIPFVLFQDGKTIETPGKRGLGITYIRPSINYITDSLIVESFGEKITAKKCTGAVRTCFITNLEDHVIHFSEELSKEIEKIQSPKQKRGVCTRFIDSVTAIDFSGFQEDITLPYQRFFRKGTFNFGGSVELRHEDWLRYKEAQPRPRRYLDKEGNEYVDK